MIIREADFRDAAAIAAVHHLSWREAYRGIVPERVLEELDLPRLAEFWTRTLGEAPWPTFVTEADSGIVGFCSCVPARDGDLERDRAGEISAIYLHPDSWGRGLGRALCRQALAALAARRCREAILWAFEANHRAACFCEAIGFRRDGGRKDHPDLGLPLVRYRIDLVEREPGS